MLLIWRNAEQHTPNFSQHPRLFSRTLASRNSHAQLEVTLCSPEKLVYILLEQFSHTPYMSSRQGITLLPCPPFGLDEDKLEFGILERERDKKLIFYNTKKIENPVIGYFHVCLKENWQISFDRLWRELKQSGVYDRTREIRLGIVQDGEVEEDIRFRDQKIRIVANGKCKQYERVTLLKLRQDAETDAPNTLYWYAHTKGIRHWGTPTQTYIKAWLNVMEESNFKNWRWAVQVLSDKRADVYGCLYMHHSYLSGNFWWASNEHVRHFHIPWKNTILLQRNGC